MSSRKSSAKRVPEPSDEIAQACDCGIIGFGVGFGSGVPDSRDHESGPSVLDAPPRSPLVNGASSGRPELAAPPGRGDGWAPAVSPSILRYTERDSVNALAGVTYVPGPQIMTSLQLHEQLRELSAFRS